MLPTPNAHPLAVTPPRRLPTIALTWCVASFLAAALLPAWAQTAASTDKAQERSQQQSDNVYRWIKYFADQPKKAEPSKPRPKADTPQLAKKPETKAPADPPQAATTTAADTAAAPSAAPPAAEATLQAQQQPAPQTIPAAAPAAPQATVVAEAIQPLRPVVVVEPTIPREMRDESINTTVRLSFTVQPDGTIATPEVITGNNRRLNRSALQAIAQWRFEPIQTARLTQIDFDFRQE
jgi:TonB family protein